MKTTKIKSVNHNFGEISYTDKNFIGKLVSENLENNVIKYFDGKENYQIKINDVRLISSDNFGLVEVEVTSINDTEILFFDNDEGLSIRVHKNYNFFIIRNFKNLAKIDDEKLVYSLLCNSKNWGLEYSQNILNLLVYTGKSNFKLSLKNQVVEWFNNWIEGKLNKYNKPLSDRQYAGLTKYNPENRKYLNYAY